MTDVRPVSSLTDFALSMAERVLEDAQTAFERACARVVRSAATVEGIDIDRGGWKLDVARREWFREFPVPSTITLIEVPNAAHETPSPDTNPKAG